MRHYMIAVALLLAGFTGFKGQAADMAEDVSMLQLIATPEKYDGKFVRVFGYLILEFEGNAVYLHREDLVQGLSRNALWVDRTEAMERDEKKLSGHYVLIEGIFDAQGHGHMGLFSGVIKDITRVETWPPKPRHYEDLTHRLPLLPDERLLVGSWRITSETENQRWTFEPNHTFWIASDDQTKVSRPRTGRWYIAEADKVLVIDPGKPGEVGFLINEISENTLTLAGRAYARYERPNKPSK